MHPFSLRSDDGEEEEAGSARVVERRREKLESFCESEIVRTPGGEEIASYSERSCAKSYGAGCKIWVR
jgi:hypothetical protein